MSIGLALFSNICFASASLLFTHYSRTTSVYWMNMFKCGISTLGCGIAILFIPKIDWSLSNLYFFISGIVGLMVGDIFLLKAFTHLGPGRSLLLYGFQPLFLALAGYYLFQQSMATTQYIAILLLLGCLLAFSLESKKVTKTWGVKGLSFALVGVSLDTVGIVLTKFGFENNNTHFFQANFVRSLGAFLGFVLLSYFIKINFVKTFKTLSIRDKKLVGFGSFAGTFLSLSIYMAAIQIGHLASLSAIAVTGPFTATMLESLIHRKSPSIYLIVAFLLFIVGFFLLLLTK
ncbi:MAG: DMT family transporter [Bdellovibrionales bacterium]|nr:DMT family transporter [Bdellovibrionales bacterium]